MKGIEVNLDVGLCLLFPMEEWRSSDIDETYFFLEPLGQFQSTIHINERRALFFRDNSIFNRKWTLLLSLKSLKFWDMNTLYCVNVSRSIACAYWFELFLRWAMWTMGLLFEKKLTLLLFSKTHSTITIG